jgi:tripartite-type tricarboxylate transporter receptor subunit TctC
VHNQTSNVHIDGASTVHFRALRRSSIWSVPKESRVIAFTSRALSSGRRAAFALMSLAVLAAGAGSALAQDAAAYPDRPVRIVVPFPPGGAADIYARMVAQKLSEAWGQRQPVVIDNRAGAGGVIGTDVAAKAPADGSTLLMVTIGHAVNPSMYARLPYDTRADLVPVGVVAQVPSIVVASPSLKGKTLAEVLAMARAQPESLQYASSGVGTTSHVGATRSPITSCSAGAAPL